jgi:hypothetical protein
VLNDISPLAAARQSTPQRLAWRGDVAAGMPAARRMLSISSWPDHLDDSQQRATGMAAGPGPWFEPAHDGYGPSLAPGGCFALPAWPWWLGKTRSCRTAPLLADWDGRHTLKCGRVPAGTRLVCIEH